MATLRIQLLLFIVGVAIPQILARYVPTIAERDMTEPFFIGCDDEQQEIFRVALEGMKERTRWAAKLEDEEVWGVYTIPGPYTISCPADSTSPNCTMHGTACDGKSKTTHAIATNWGPEGSPFQAPHEISLCPGFFTKSKADAKCYDPLKISDSFTLKDRVSVFTHEATHSIYPGGTRIGDGDCCESIKCLKELANKRRKDPDHNVQTQWVAQTYPTFAQAVYARSEACQKDPQRPPGRPSLLDMTNSRSPPSGRVER
ncbi:MAG: hypothetical protein M1833_006002 [Piccolia ochrophora]|nr:MAG: hypothetical protein M1833_006002 [Piccolia ochrophora]